jgi:hypothetical protein
MASHKNQHFVPRCYLKPFSLDGKGFAINLYGNYMDSKAMKDMLYESGQAGADELKRCFPNFRVPEGLIIQDIEEAEDLVIDWRHSGESRALDLAVKVYERLTAARQSALVVRK